MPATRVITARQPTTDALAIVRRRYVADDPEAAALLEEIRAEAPVARRIYELRTAAKLSQRQLAAKVGTTASVICRLEDADYEGHSLAMLFRIAAAVGQRIELRFVPAGKGRRTG